MKVCISILQFLLQKHYCQTTRNIEIADVATRKYAAAHTGSPMFAVQMAINVPSDVHIAQLREEFLEICDRLNLDAILEPVKA